MGRYNTCTQRLDESLEVKIGHNNIPVLFQFIPIYTERLLNTIFIVK